MLQVLKSAKIAQKIAFLIKLIITWKLWHFLSFLRLPDTEKVSKTYLKVFRMILWRVKMILFSMFEKSIFDVKKFFS